MPIPMYIIQWAPHKLRPVAFITASSTVICIALKFILFFIILKQTFCKASFHMRKKITLATLQAPFFDLLESSPTKKFCLG